MGELIPLTRRAPEPTGTAQPSMGAVADWDRLSIHYYTVAFIPTKDARGPRPSLPAMLRESLELSFRLLVCRNIDLDCGRCTLQGLCPFPPVFRRSPAPEATRRASQQEPPRPFLFEPPEFGKGRIREGDWLEYGLTLFGAANRWLPYFVVALRAATAQALGRTSVQLELHHVHAITPDNMISALDSTSARVMAVDIPTRLADLMCRADDRAHRIRVTFITPTTPGRNRRTGKAPSFGELIRGARDRLLAVASCYGDGPPNVDLARLGKLADKVRTVRCKMTEQGPAAPETSGFSGEVVFEGDIVPFMPLLRMAEVLHLGKWATWGDGQVYVNVEEQG